MLGRACRDLARLPCVVPNGLRDAAKVTVEAFPVELADCGYHFRDPRAVSALDRRECALSGCRRDEESGPLVAWVVLVARKTVCYEFVGDALNALPLEPEPAGDVRDGGAIAGLEDHAPGMCLTCRRGHSLPGVAQEPVDLEDGMQCRVGVGVHATLL
jgi:hypothetical protein